MEIVRLVSDEGWSTDLAKIEGQLAKTGHSMN
jgi:hypothetical protein